MKYNGCRHLSVFEIWFSTSFILSDSFTIDGNTFETLELHGSQNQRRRPSASEMTYIVSSGALNSTHSLM